MAKRGRKATQVSLNQLSMLSHEDWAEHDMSGSAPPLARVGDPLPRHGDYQLVLNEDDLFVLATELEDANANSRFVAYDTEFSGAGRDINPHLKSVKLIGISIALRDGSGALRAWYVPVAHRGLPPGTQLPPDVTRRVLAPRLRRARLAGHNWKIDAHVLAYAGYGDMNCAFDTYTASHHLEHLLRPHQEAHALRKDGKWSGVYLKGLKALTASLLGVSEVISFEQIMARAGQKPGGDFAVVSLDDALCYASDDAAHTLQLCELLEPMITGTSMDAMFQVDMQLLPALARMERRGILIDPVYIERLFNGWTDETGQQIKGFTQIIGEADAEIRKLVGQPIRNDGQIRWLLYDKWDLPVFHRTQGDIPSVAADTLSELRDYVNGALDLKQKPKIVRVLDLLHERGILAKIVSTYDLRRYKVRERNIDGKTYYVLNTTINESGASSGRLSTDTPSLQNIPTRSEAGKAARRAIVALLEARVNPTSDYWDRADTSPTGRRMSEPEGPSDLNPLFRLGNVEPITWPYKRIFGVFDLSQIEPRVAAWYIALMGDETFLDVYRDPNGDIYKTMAALMLDILVRQVGKNQRNAAKILILAILYGASARGLSGKEALRPLGQDGKMPSAKEIEVVLENLFTKVAGIRRYHWNVIAWALYLGYNETPLGQCKDASDLRRPTTDGQWASRRSGESRTLRNRNIQGMAAHMMKMSIIFADHMLTELGLNDKISLLLSVHDELDVDFDPAYTIVARALFHKALAEIFNLGAPAKIDAELGPNWADILPLEIEPEGACFLIESQKRANPEGGKDIEVVVRHPLPEQASETGEILERLEAFTSPFLDMSRAKIVTPFDMAWVSDDDLPIYAWHAANLKVGVPDDRFPMLNIDQPLGFITDTRMWKGKNGKRDTFRATMVTRDGCLRLVQWEQPFEEGFYRAYGVYEPLYGTFRVDELVPLGDLRIFRDHLRSGTPLRDGDSIYRFDTLRKELDRVKLACSA